MNPRLKSLVVLASLSCLPFAALHGVTHDWPQWRGPDRTGISKETGLLKKWPEGGPKRVWMFQNAGNGYTAPAIVDGKLFTMGTRGGSEVLLVLDANSGQELGVTKISGIFDNDRGGGPRGTPTVDGDRVYVLSGPGTLACVGAGDGKVKWQTTMRALGGRVPNWGFSESVLVDGDMVLCTPGGDKGAVAAFDKMTGELRWQSKDFKDPAHYSSIVSVKINGEHQYVQRSATSVVGLSPKDGKVLWETDFPGRTAVAPTPIVRGNEVYVTAGYGAGCKMFRVEPGNKVKVVYENKVMKNHHGGVILVGEHLYGHADPTWVCQDFKTGEQLWSHRGFGKGAVAYADGMLYCLEETSGSVALVEASPTGWREHGRFKPEPQSEMRAGRGMVWTHPVISNGKLYLRDQDLIYCYDIKG